MDKSAIRNFAIEARKILMKSAITEAGFYGITKEECKAPIQKGNDFEVYETLAGTENRIFGDEIKKRANLVEAIKEQGFEQVIEETAYTWFNRIIAIRFMEVNNYLPSRVRVLSSESGSGTPDVVTQADTVELNLTQEELLKIQQAKNDNKYDDAFRLLFIKQCNELNAILPGLFEKTNDYMELLLKLPYTSDGVIRMLVDSIPEDNFNVETEGQVEIIGWMYQYYNTELKDDTFAKLKKNIKITKERVPAATQLFTPDWIVRYMVENSLGRTWIEHLVAADPTVDESEKAKEFGWTYYLPEASQCEDITSKLIEIRSSYKDMTPQDLICIDPCMGSGHILVYIFDVLMDIYRSEGFSEREAVFDILEKNIRGLDIDRRAYQLSYFALMMKARGYNRIFFRGRENIDGVRIQTTPMVFAIEESNSINRNQLNYFGEGLSEIEKNDALNQINGLLDQLLDAREYGSILNIEKYNWTLLKRFICSYSFEGQMDLGMVGIELTGEKVRKCISVAECLADKYEVVVTNPPYMNSSGMNPKLGNFVKENYPNSKSDISFCFMEKCKSLSKTNGKYALINIPVWMNLSSCEKLRIDIINTSMLLSLLNFGRGVFGSDFGSCAFVFENISLMDYGSIIWKLFKKQGSVDSLEHKKAIFDSREGYKIFSLRQFLNMPGAIISCMLGEKSYDHFIHDENVGVYATARQGMATADNKRFLRLWYEVSGRNSSFSILSGDELASSDIKWVPYAKGGAFRKWYGNNDYVVNWYGNGLEIRNFKKSVVRNPDYYFKTGLTWTALTAGNFSMRYIPSGYCFDSMGPVCFLYDNGNMNYLLGLLNSNVGKLFLQILCPNFKFDQGPLEKVPFIYCEDKNSKINSLVEKCIEIEKEEWDYYETSWGFTEHPIIKFANGEASVEKGLAHWIQYCADRREDLKRYEEEINRIFIDIYSLQNEVDYQVEEEELVYRIPSEEDAIKSLVSYAVGCMLGRYSLSQKGVVCSNNNLSAEDYSEFTPVKDNILLITDEKYISGDIVDKFEEWVKVAFGAETYEENIQFIARALNSKSDNPSNAIREYFVTKFFDNHAAEYSISGSGKRPIYWEFDSGKSNGFKCLIYSLRYQNDVLGNIRTDYLVKTQEALDNALKNLEYVVQTSSSAVDKASATKRRDKIIKQISELRSYYQAISHMALQKIDLDIDNGVRDNYSQFQGIEVVADGNKKQKIDLLAKI